MLHKAFGNCAASSMKLTLDCRRLARCAGPCRGGAVAGESRWTYALPGHTTEVTLTHALVCRGCNRRWLEFEDMLLWGRDSANSTLVAEAEEWFEHDAHVVRAKFAQRTPGAVHYLAEAAETADTRATSA